MQGGQVDRESLCAASRLNKDEDVILEIDLKSTESQKHSPRGIPRMAMPTGKPAGVNSCSHLWAGAASPAERMAEVLPPYTPFSLVHVLLGHSLCFSISFSKIPFHSFPEAAGSKT